MQKYHINSKISDCDDQKTLFKVVDTLTSAKCKSVLPSHDSSKDLACRINTFFADKVTQIRNDLKSKASMSSIPAKGNTVHEPSVSLNVFEPATEEEIRKLISSTKAKSSAQDPVPTSLIKECSNEFIPIITRIINLSLEQGVVPSNMKKAQVTPLLKKPSLDSEILANYRPISNLTYVSKLAEKVVSNRIKKHMVSHNLQEKFQSAYKKHHSCETALLRIHNDILLALDNKKVVALLLLDLSAAFDTVSHEILIERLQNLIGIQGIALDWLKSYLSDRVQQVVINGEVSDLWNLLFGVPQGSVLGPLLFIIYTGPLGEIIRSHNISYHLYAGDTQIYLSFDISELTDAKEMLECCVQDIRLWMNQNMLRLNDDKTELMFIKPRNLTTSSEIFSISVGDESTTASPTAKNIGVYFDEHFLMLDQISHICSSAWGQLRRIGKIRPFLNSKSAEHVIHAFVTSRLDQNNSLLAMIPEYQLKKLKRIQYAAARVLLQKRIFGPMTPIILDLHWLPIPLRINFKILLLVYKCLNGLAPKYLSELIKLKSPARSLRSSNKVLLECPKSNTVTYGDRAFSVIAPKIWNPLPLYIKEATSCDSFKHCLKTYMFKTILND